jgi:hypothetical protein
MDGSFVPEAAAQVIGSYVSSLGLSGNYELAEAKRRSECRDNAMSAGKLRLRDRTGLRLRPPEGS